MIMATLTLSVDEHATERAREAAQQMGTTLNQLLREQIERLAGFDQRIREAQAYLSTPIFLFTPKIQPVRKNNSLPVA
jgi:antitoxin component of RelBE/YafQ-DinJ toxin-antitoxin module